MSEIKNGRLGLYCAEHSKFNRMMKLGFKGLNRVKPSWLGLLVTNSSLWS